MIVLRWLVLLFLIMRLVNVRGAGTLSCMPFPKCKRLLEIENQEERNDRFNPLYLTRKSGTYKLAIPRAAKEEEGSTDIAICYTNKKNVIYACPKEEKNGSEIVSTALIEQDHIKIPETKKSNVHCSKKVEPKLKKLNKICREATKNSEEFNLYEVGFKVFVKHRSMLDKIKKITKSKGSEKHVWLPLYQICHNVKTRTTLYTIHTLYGESVHVASSDNGESVHVASSDNGESVHVASSDFNITFKDFDRIEQLDGNAPEEFIDPLPVSLDDLFQKSSVQNLFREVFELPKTQNYVNTENDYFTRGQLVPEADMAFIPWKNATNVYANVVPMWEYVNDGIWKSIETQVREAAKKSKKNFKIYTGVSKTLYYESKDIFLGGKDTNILPIPFYVWKVVQCQDKKENRAIVFVVVNDPWLPREPLCDYRRQIGLNYEELCTYYGWQRSMDREIDGKWKTMLCCVWEDFRNKLSHPIPDMGDPDPLENPARPEPSIPEMGNRNFMENPATTELHISDVGNSESQETSGPI